ncbi:MAG: hypothetical protein A3F10_05480 [Coxiella sp. RIFCSPHIGHO2_12_FULL_42_15]|nr:MAG: hypothetical protein A3F10_05480 [Coxiella sp. RIFCSPHIGHO2_12_FULL_42_15]
MKKFIRAVGGMYHSVIYTDTDGRHFRFSGGTWTWRNHNPGNVWSGRISKKHNQIGETHHFAIFPDDKSGHASLLDTLITTYGNASIHEMIYSYAPPKENPTKKYEALLRKNTGIYDDTPIKKFTKNQFEKFWKTIQQMEGYQVGKTVEVYQISAIQALGKSRYQYCLKEDNWISGSECISLAEKGGVELEVCLSKLHHQFLRTPPNSLFQEKLENLICRKY